MQKIDVSLNTTYVEDPMRDVNGRVVRGALE